MIFDNVLYHKEVIDPKNKKAIALAAFNQKIANDTTSHHTLLPLGDGIMLVQAILAD